SILLLFPKKFISPTKPTCLKSFSTKNPKSISSSFNNEPESGTDNPSSFVDEWGEKTEPESEPTSRFTDSDPPKKYEDEWGGIELGNGTTPVEQVVVGPTFKEDLKRALVDAVYGSELGFKASAEVRGEALELVSHLEAANPTPAPTDCPELLHGNWVLVYTAFSELLPLLAAGSIPLVKVEKICQSIDTSSLVIENSTTLSSPVS
ncbi:PAP/fibrillin family protein, partial [Acinetobacter baumannii]